MKTEDQWKRDRRWMDARLRRRGRYFSRNYKNDPGLQILIMGCMWISVGVSDYYTPKMNREYHKTLTGNTEHLDGVYVSWTECATLGMINA